MVRRLKETQNPLDTLEDYFESQSMDCERHGETSLACRVTGAWGIYTIYFYWHEEMPSLELACLLEFPVIPCQYPALWELMGAINPEIFIGHFEICSDRKLISYRYSLVWNQDSPPSIDQMEQLMDIALFEGERFFPAFDFVLNHGKTPQEALESSVLNTVGEA